MSKKIILLIFAITFIAIPFTKVEAKTLGDLKNELKALEKKYAEAENKKNLTETEINNLKTEINTITANIQKTKEDIKKAEDDIVENENKIEEKREETDELLKFLQISSGENVYLEYIFEADSYTDFIYRYSVVSQLTEYNNNLMSELEVLVENLEKEKEELKNKKSRLETQSGQLTSKLAVLRVNLEGYKEEGTTIEDDIKDMKKKIKELEDINCKDNEDITSCGRNGVMVNATGWSYPLAWGCVTSEYVGFGERLDWSGPATGHHGIDLDCVSEGTTVYAAAPGLVARVEERLSCGGNVVWVYHNVNGTPYTTVYMHLLYISVKEGQTVTSQTKIGGLGGESTKSYDGCTGGKHLHFGMAYGHNAYGFNNFSFNPRNIYNFPAIYYSGGGYFSR
ncbi:MAG: peptidoglycan DD-metalloendopeptidase family protein [Bacilli bacterium]|nr:peptidoglycan DD-metalloendopeptidase family protein [Bacilli bacterium]